MQRVMIVGGPGSGKSTLARALGARTGLPVYHMDHIHWQSGWVERALPDKVPLALAVQARDQWIFEGGLSRTYADRIARADTFIWLDLPVGLRFWRVLRRSVIYWGRARPDLLEGCVERFGPETLPFWRFIWRTRQSSRVPLLAVVADPPAHLHVVHLCKVREVRAFLASVSSQ
jgi:adenylate kinase family enzyme